MAVFEQNPHLRFVPTTEMDGLNEGELINPIKNRSLKFFIIARGCSEYEELVDLRAERWRDPLLRDNVNERFTTTRQKADECSPQNDLYWLPVMASSLKYMDERTRCIPSGTFVRFLDLGCCPGGFSKYVLTKNPSSQGVGVSLAVEDGGYGLAIPSPECSRFEMHWGDLTYYDICSPLSRRLRRLPAQENTLVQTPFSPQGFQLAMLDGQHRRPQESASTHKWDNDRLLVAQLIIGMESLDAGGTFIVKLNYLESSITARLLYMIDKISKATVAFKPYVHATKASFYAIGFGFGLGVCGCKRRDYLYNLKNVWWELTHGGPDGEGRWLREEDLDFIIDFDTLRTSYLDRLIKLGRGSWRVQRNALMKMFTRIRNGAQESSIDESENV